jgi:hypothetical protein
VIGRTLVQIRERPALDLLDLALVVVRSRPRTIGLAALAGIAPFAALNAWLFHAFPEFPPILAMSLWLVEAPFATAPLTVVLGGLMFGQSPGVGKVVATVFRATFPLVIVQLILRDILFCWLAPHLAFANEVILLEKGRSWKSFRRGGDLASGREGELFLLGLTQVVMTYLFGLLAYLGSVAVGRAMLAEQPTWDVPEGAEFAGWLFQVPLWLATAYFAVVRFLAYIDQRIRLEGWEVELRLRALGDAIREARRW